jgi:hypothetical protein
LKKASVLLRLDIKEDAWEQLAETTHDKDMNGYVNMLAMFSGRVIAILGDRMPKFYDTVQKAWIQVKLAPGSHPVVPRMYPGAL